MGEKKNRTRFTCKRSVVVIFFSSPPAPLHPLLLLLQTGAGRLYGGLAARRRGEAANEEIRYPRPRSADRDRTSCSFGHRTPSVLFFRPPTPPPGLVLTLVNRTKWNVSACCEVKTGLKEKKKETRRFRGGREMPTAVTKRRFSKCTVILLAAQ